MQKENFLLCYKYLIRLIKSEKQLHELAASYIETATQNGVDEETALLMYCGLVIRRTGLQEQYDFLSVNGQRFSEADFLKYIKSDQVSKYSSCTKYAESVDLPCLGCCKLCSTNSGRTYLNTYQKEELRLLKFINNSYENMIFFKSNSSATLFKCQTDVASEMISNAPVIIPLHRTLYQKLSGQKETFFRNNEKDRLIKIMPTVFTTIAKSNAPLLELMKNNSSLLNTYIDVYISEIIASEEITPDLCLELINKIGKKKTNKSTKNKILTYSLFDIDENNAVKSKTSETDNEQPSSDTALLNNVDKDKTGQSNDALNDDSPDFQVNEDPAEVPQKDEIFSADTDNSDNNDEDELPFPIDTIVEDDTENIQEVSEEQSENDSNSENGEDVPTFFEENGTPNEDPLPEETSDDNPEEPQDNEPDEDLEQKKQAQTTTKESTGRNIPLDSLEDYIIKIVCDRAAFTNGMSDYISEENKIFGAINKSKALPIEIFMDEDNQYFFVLWIKELGKYVYTMANQVPITLKVLLEHKSIMKICYQPYYLYSLGKILGIKLKNVHPIYTYDRGLRKGSNLLFKETTEYYINLLEYKPEPKDYKKANLNLLLNTMPLYVYMSGRQQKMADTLSDEELKKFNDLLMRDYVIGVSFMRAVNLNDFSVMCSLDNSNKCHFNTDFVRNVKNDGFIVTYNITSTFLTAEQVHNLYKASLIELAEKGRFRKLNIQLLAIHENNLIIFYGIDEYELLVTLMQNYFNSFAIYNKIKDFKMVVDHKRYYSDPDAATNKKEMKIHSLEGVLDALATVDKKVEVKDTHIKRDDAITTNKRKINSQTKTFPPRRE